MESPHISQLLLGNWRGVIPSPWIELLLVLTAMVCGVIVGGEREKKEKPAGLRTMLLVCLGSAVYTIVSFVFTSSTGDSGRVAAQIVTGIGFVGAGVIMHESGSVRGVTTAATIWVVAALGMAVGVGYPQGGLLLSLLVRATLSGTYLWEDREIHNKPPTVIEILYDPDHGKTHPLIERILDEYRLHGLEQRRSAQPDGLEQLHLRYWASSRQRIQMLSEIAGLRSVRGIQVGSSAG